MKRKRINPISQKRKVELEREHDIRRQLCERAKGYFVASNGQWRCIGGICELCGQSPNWIGLHPHEDKFRSKGGKLALDNSVMLCDTCHKKEHHIKVAGKKEED